MKTFLSILAACGLGFGIAYYISAKQTDSLKREQARMETEFQSRIKGLESELATERNKAPLVERITEQQEVAGSTKRTPKEILARLMELRPAGQARGPILRKIIHELEELAELNEVSVVPIREFLAQNTDLDYGVERSRGDGDDRGRFNPWQRSSPTMEFTLPPSLRIGLFDVLKEIGSPSAEETLAEVMGKSGRAVEVAYLARMLQDMVPNKYRAEAVASACDLLRNPLPIDNPNRLDEQAEGYLYGVLEMYNDASFVADAKRMLTGADGRLNRNAQQYLAKILGEQMVGTYYDLYKASTVSNNWDKMSLGNRILDYAGTNPQANTFLSEILGNPDIDSRMKSFAIMRLAGGFDRSDRPTDPNVISSRITLVDTLRQGTTDERMLRVLDDTKKNLEDLAAGKEPAQRNWGDRDRRGGNTNDSQTRP